jgi:hypothetical protein
MSAVDATNVASASRLTADNNTRPPNLGGAMLVDASTVTKATGPTGGNYPLLANTTSPDPPTLPSSTAPTTPPPPNNPSSDASKINDTIPTTLSSSSPNDTLAAEEARFLRDMYDRNAPAEEIAELMQAIRARRAGVAGPSRHSISAEPRVAAEDTPPAYDFTS